MARARARETSGASAREATETKTAAKRVHCLRTLRAHRDAAYCVVLSKSGVRLVTGGDDRLVKIWCAHTGLLRAACRGHVGEITYVTVDPNDRLIASASTDTSVRTWRLEDGSPVAVLLGHTASITELHFCPAKPHVLLSTSDDGTVRLWSAEKSSNQVKPMVIDLNNGGVITGGTTETDHAVPMPLSGMTDDATSPGVRTRGAQLQAIADESVENQHRREEEACQVVCGAFNALGDIFAVGTTTCKVFMWQFVDLDAVTESPTAGCVKKIDLSGSHLNDVVSVYFSNAGNLLLSASKDGQARIWAPGTCPGRLRWTLRTTLTTPDDAAALREQLRMGSLTTVEYSRRAPRVPNMHIAMWSSDDKRVIASMGDQTIRVWNSATGELLHIMREHSAATYVLHANPVDSRLVMSASYDGKAVIWDIIEGVALRVFDGSHYNSKLVDGNWHPDGTSIVVSDLAGQFSVFGTGDSLRFLRTKYEQFFQTEFMGDDLLGRSEGGHLIELATGMLLHEAFPRNLLCDSMGDPYPDPYQSAYLSGTVGAYLPTADANMMDVTVQVPTLAELAPMDVQGPWTMPELPDPAQEIVYRSDDDDDPVVEEEDDDDFEEPEDDDDEDEDESSDDERQRRSARRRNRRVRSQRRSLRFDSDESEESESEDLATRRSERAHRRPQRLGVEEYDSDEQEESPRITRLRRREMRALGIESEEEDESEEEEKPAKRQKKAVTSRHDIRLHESYSWFCAEQLTIGSYVPQLGDKVVYIAQGHYERMQEHGKDWHDEAPWQTLTQMRFVEPCVVSSLRYIISDDGTYETHGLLELKLIDPSCGNYGKEFLIALHRSDAPDFLVPLSRYREAEKCAWKKGDLCAALWDEMGASTPWYGMIEKVRRHEGEWAGSPWNTLCVQYFNVQNEDDRYMDHSFWELYKDELMRKEHAKLLSGASTSRGPQKTPFSNVDESSPSLTPGVTKELLSRVLRLARNDRFEAFVNVIGPNEKFTRADGTVTNYCSLVPVPMALNLIINRLKNSYYRQIDGFRSDVELIRVNAEIFHGEGSVFANFAAELEDDLLDDLPSTDQSEPDIDGMKVFPTITKASAPAESELPNGGRVSLRVKMRRG